MDLDSEAYALSGVLTSQCKMLLKNNASTARDHLANERTFLSWLRLSVTLSIVSLAIIVSFHLHDVPTQLEEHMAVPLGIIFWLLAMLTLANGVVNYANTIKGYTVGKVIVESGPKTIFTFCIIAIAIFAVCILFILIGAIEKRSNAEDR